MNKEIALATRQETSLAKQQEEIKALQLQRSADLELSAQARSLVVSKLQGTPIQQATLEQLELMWTKISRLLSVSVKDENDHLDNCMATAAWLQRYYPWITIEEILEAYGLACSQQLKIAELFSLISPKHCGIVLGAYQRYIEGNKELNRIFREQHLIEPPEQSTEQIDAFMESAVQLALVEVRQNKFYYDHGNGLFDWLYAQGRIEMTDPQKLDYWNRAVNALPKLLQRERDGITTGDMGKVSVVDKLLRDAENNKYNGDNSLRAEAHAKRLVLNDYLKTLL